MVLLKGGYDLTIIVEFYHHPPFASVLLKRATSLFIYGAVFENIFAVKTTGYMTVLVIVALATAVAIYIHFSSLRVKDPTQTVPKPVSSLDIRPLIVKKLQQLIKDGSGGLYHLSIEKLEPDIARSQLDVVNATLTPDSAALKKLDSSRKAPDDIYRISFRALHVNGITISDLIHSEKISLDSIVIKEPLIEVYHERRSYNEAQRERDSTASLYGKIMKEVKYFSARSVTIEHGTLITKKAGEKKKSAIFNDVSATFKDLLIDSVTQFDKNRFLFSKEAELSCKDFLARTPDSLYFFKVGSISVLAAKHKMIGTDVELVPRGSKKEFEKKLSTLNDRYDIRFPKIVLTDVDWWSLANNESLIAGEAQAYDGVIKDYIDRSLPPPSHLNFDNFPSQLFLRVPLKIDVGKIDFQHLKIAYEEYNPKIRKTSGFHFGNVNGTLRNLTNIKTSIDKNPHVSFSGSGTFMSATQTRCNFQFDLSKPKTADCSVDLQMGTLDKSILNPITEPLGLFTVKSGEMKQGTVHLEGDIFTMRCSILMLYNDLHLTPLKPDGDSSGSLKKKSVTSFLANVLFIKDDNPSKGEPPRNIDVVVQRDHHDHFFNFLWKSLLTGLVKTIGVPEKYVNRNSGK